jgi:hypothetical protein
MADGADGGWLRLAERGSRQCDAGRGGSGEGEGASLVGLHLVAGSAVSGRLPLSFPHHLLRLPTTHRHQGSRPATVMSAATISRSPRDSRRNGSHRFCRCRSKSSAPSSSSSIPSPSSPPRKHRALFGPSSTLPAMNVSSDCSPSSCCPNMAVSRLASASATAPSYRPRTTPISAETSTPARCASSSARTYTLTTTPSYACD